MGEGGKEPQIQLRGLLLLTAAPNGKSSEKLLNMTCDGDGSLQRIRADRQLQLQVKGNS